MKQLELMYSWWEWKLATSRKLFAVYTDLEQHMLSCDPAGQLWTQHPTEMCTCVHQRMRTGTFIVDPDVH